MTPEEIIRVVRENIGKKVKATPTPPWTTPYILLIESVDGEGFLAYDITPDHVESTELGHTPYCDVAEVEPVEDSKSPTT